MFSKVEKAVKRMGLKENRIEEGDEGRHGWNKEGREK